MKIERGISVCLLWLALVAPVNAQIYDLVLTGGRVMDPASGLDAVRNVAIQDGQIAAIESKRLEGRQTISVEGLIVAPGFIDLHAHGQNDESRLLQAADGVTTALELEIGVYPVQQWYASQQGKSVINYGATVGHLAARTSVMDGVEIGHLSTTPPSERQGLSQGSSTTEPATDEQIAAIGARIQEGLDAGALGVGFGIAYTPGAAHREIYSMFKVAARNDAVCFVHMRNSSSFTDNESIGCVQEIIANAAASGASAHIVHLGSSGGKQAKTCLEMIRGARARGIDVTTEVYPYTASSTSIQSAIYAGNWAERTGEDYSEIVWVATGERLTKETFHKYREIGGWVINHGMDPEIIGWLVAQPDVIIASDGMPFTNGRAHPRGAGTFSRFLGYYARDRGAMPLMDALKKITLDPARRLESMAPAMRKKGRIRVGADADITVFDAHEILDRATFTEPAQRSAGIAHVLVGGVFVVRDFKPVEGVAPGRPVRTR